MVKLNVNPREVVVFDQVKIANFGDHAVTIDCHFTKPKSHKAIQLEQNIKWHKQVIEHNERMIAKYEEELKNEGV